MLIFELSGDFIIIVVDLGGDRPMVRSTNLLPVKSLSVLFLCRSAAFPVVFMTTFL